MKNFPEINQKIWKVKTPYPVLSSILARQLGITPVTAQLLINRGVYTVEQGRWFLDCELGKLPHPLQLKDMDKAVSRVLKAVELREKILVYGDYDADGITSTTLTTHLLRRLGADVDYYIPNRLVEGYGLHLHLLQQFRHEGRKLVLTVDCGINAIEESKWAAENGLDLVITDHHEPALEIPRACAVINPKRKDCIYPYKELAGVGVALKLAQALLEEVGGSTDAWLDYLDLVCLGTIADIVPVQGENRILVKHGLKYLVNSNRVGLRALIDICGTKGRELGPREVGFGLAPRLNAAGRIGSPDLAVKLLLTEDIIEANEISEELEKRNQERQKIEVAVLNDALQQMEARRYLDIDRVLVLASDKWHPGVIGIVASRLADRYCRPVLMITIDGSEGKGSARSISGFNIHHALTHCREHLLSFGGHELAAGFSIEKSKIEDLRREIILYAEKQIYGVVTRPILVLDDIVQFSQVSEDLVKEIDLLQPFGHQNPEPLLGCRDTAVLESRGVGKNGAHLKLRLRGETANFDGIGFNLGSYAGELNKHEKTLDIAFLPAFNVYNGRRSVQLNVKDLGLPALVEMAASADRDIFLPDCQHFSQEIDEAEEQEDLYMPEFISGQVRNLRTQNIKAAHQTTGFKPAEIKVMGKRLDILAEEAGRPVLKLVVTPWGCRAIELAHYLALTNPGLWGRITYCHGLLPQRVRQELISLFAAGVTNTMVVTPAVAGDIQELAERVIMYHLPFSPEEINCSLRALRNGGKLLLLYDPKDFDHNLTELSKIAPDRDYLAGLYRILHRGGNCDVEKLIDFELTSKLLMDAGFLNSNRHTLEIGLTILEELNLIRPIKNRKEIIFKLLPSPPQKKDLSEAPTFRQMQLIKEETTAWMKKVINNSGEGTIHGS